MEGWIKLFRVLLDKPIWLKSTPEQKTILITLLLMTNHKDMKWEWNGERYNLKQGQFVTSLSGIAKKGGRGISIRNVRTALERFKKYEFLTYESTKTGRLITILNWKAYQNFKDDTDKELTKRKQRTVKELTTNKNDKNEKNDTYDQNSNEFRLAAYLYRFIKQNNPNAKKPDMQKWAKQFDYILRIDKRDVDEAKKVIVWCQDDEFWFKNILSPDKLRSHYDRLVLQMEGKRSHIKSINDCSSAIDNF